MALAIALDPHDTGFASGYWRITQAQLDFCGGQATVWLHGWRDAAARHAGRTPAASLTLHLAAADFPGGDLHAADTAALYAALRSRAAAEADNPGYTRAVPGADCAILATAQAC